MSLNVGAIFVTAKSRMDACRVAEETQRYWKSKGAADNGLSPLGLKPLAVSEGKADRLGVAIAPVTQGWIGVRDSERYTADHGLAKALSKALGTRVCWFTISGATDGAILQTFENGKPSHTVEGQDRVLALLKEMKVPDPTLYFDDLRKKKLPGWALVSVGPIASSNYDCGPEPSEEDEEDDGPPPPKTLAGFFAKLDQGVLLSDADWERIEGMDPKLIPDICRLGLRALEGKEARSWVLLYLAPIAIKGGDLALFKKVIERAPFTKKDPINQAELMDRLCSWLSYQIYKGPIPADWHPSVEALILAALPFTSRLPEIHVGVAEAYARMGNTKKACEHIRLAIRHGVFYGHGLDKDPVVAPLLKKPPLAAEIAKLQN